MLGLGEIKRKKGDMMKKISNKYMLFFGCVGVFVFVIVIFVVV